MNIINSKVLKETLKRPPTWSHFHPNSHRDLGCNRPKINDSWNVTSGQKQMGLSLQNTCYNRQELHFYAGQQRHLTFYIVLCFFHYCHQRGIPLSCSSWSPESRTEKGLQSFLSMALTMSFQFQLEHRSRVI